MKKKCCGKYALKGERATESALDRQEQGSHYRNAPIQAIEFIIGGSHYKAFTIQPIEFITANNLDFIQGNIIKYCLREKNTENPHEKWDKIIHYCELAKELK